VSGSDYGAKYYALEASASSASATVSASAALASQIAAASSAAAAASSFDSFDDKYLGAKSVAPTVDNDGNPLVVGALFYLDTGTAEQIGMYVYDGSGWLKASAAAVASIVTYEYTASGGQTVFSGADDNSVTMTFTSGLLQVFLNGVLLNPGNDFTTGINTVTLVSGAVSGDSLTVVAFASFNVANTYTQAQIDAALALKSPSASPTFTGTVVLPVTTDYDGTQLSTALAAKAPLASPTFTGTVTIPDVNLGAWTAYTPSWTGLSLGNGSTSAAYSQVGKTITVRFTITFGSTTTVTGPVDVTLPTSAKSSYSLTHSLGTVTFFQSSLYPGHVIFINLNVVRLVAYDASSTYASTADLTSTVPVTWATGASIHGTLTYEVD
jgi:hypothetical protein